MYQLFIYYLYYVDISKVQDDVVGDGTTSVVVLAAELLRVSSYVTITTNVMYHTCVHAGL